MAIEWTSDLAVGQSEIDEQHRELFRRINDLLEAMTVGRGRQEVERLVQFLLQYAESHFALEERHMAEHDYSGAGEHIAQHVAFTKELKGFTADLEKQGPTSVLAIRLSTQVCAWLREHVTKTDREMAGFFARKGVTIRAGR